MRFSGTKGAADRKYDQPTNQEMSLFHDLAPSMKSRLVSDKVQVQPVSVARFANKGPEQEECEIVRGFYQPKTAKAL